MPIQRNLHSIRGEGKSDLRCKRLEPDRLWSVSTRVPARLTYRADKVGSFPSFPLNGKSYIQIALFLYARPDKASRIYGATRVFAHKLCCKSASSSSRDNARDTCKQECRLLGHLSNSHFKSLSNFFTRKLSFFLRVP